MLAALKDQPALPFRIPPGVQLVEVDYDTGCLPGPETRVIITEAFKPNTGPVERCAAGGGGEGYYVDRSQAAAGDETAPSAPAEGQGLPAQDAGPDIAASLPFDPATPVDPTRPPQQTQPDELTVEDGVF
jgi:penicillin-binding protein 1A